MMRRLIVPAVVLGLAMPGAAQSVLHEWSGPEFAPFYGSAVSLAGDVDGDGYGDLWVGDRFGGGGRGVVELRSGRTGALELTLLGSDLGSEFGSAIAGGADVDGDGLLDVVVGEPLGANGGQVVLRSGLDGALLATFGAVDNDSELGRSVALVGDVNADGFVDLCAGAPRESGFWAGGVHVWSGKDGAQLRHWTGTEANDLLGTTVAGVGDVDADGRPDVAAGAPQVHPSAGYVDVWSGFDGVMLHHLVGDGDGDRFGAALDGAGDLDGDGFADILVGIPGFDQGDIDAGGMAVYSGLTGTVLRLVLGQQAYDSFGSSVASAGDADNDGRLDLAGANLPFFGGGAGVYAGSNGGELFWLPALGEGSFEALEGIQIAGGQDTNGDGIVDLGLGVARRIISPEPGFARLVSSEDLPWTKVPSGSLAGTGAVAPFLDGVGAWEPGGVGTLRLDDAQPGAPVVFILGLDLLEASFKGGTLVPSPDLAISGFVADATGSLDVPSPMPLVLPPGTQIVYQAWLTDPAAPQGFSASNGVILAQP